MLLELTPAVLELAPENTSLLAAAADTTTANRSLPVAPIVWSITLIVAVRVTETALLASAVPAKTSVLSLVPARSRDPAWKRATFPDRKSYIPIATDRDG